MKKLKWILAAVLCILAAVSLYGCKNVPTMTIDTKLEINSNFDGERIMSAAIDKNTLNTIFDGDVLKLQAMIEKYCPVQMSCRASASENGGATVEMSVPFASYSEYKNKIGTILEKAPDVNPAVYYEYSNNLFKSGYTIEEKFCSADLFYWLTDALKTEFSSLEDEDLSKLYQNGKTEIVFNGETVETDSYISYTTMASHGFKSMHAYTTINADETLTASVELTISHENREAIANLDGLMAKTASGGISMMTKRKSDSITYVYSFDAISMSSYISRMNTILRTDNTIFEITTAQDDTQTLKARQYIHQFLDASYFVDYSLPDASVVYSVTLPGKLSFDSCDGVGGYITDTDYTSDENTTTAVVVMNPSDEVTAGFGTDISLEKIDAYTKVYNDHKLERKISFYLSSDKDALIGANFTEKLNEHTNENISFEKTEGDDTAVYDVTIQAKSPKEMSSLTALFLNGTESVQDISMSGGINEKNSLHKIRFAYNDMIDFSSFLGGSDVTDGIVYTFEYPGGYTASFEDASAYEEVSQNGNRLSCKTFNKTVSVKTTAEKANVEGYLLQVFWYLSLVGILLSMLFSLPNLIRCAKARHFSGEELEIYTKKGYIIVTIFAVSIVIFAIASVRLIFGVY